jgi:hypothetical protein
MFPKPLNDQLSNLRSSSVLHSKKPSGEEVYHSVGRSQSTQRQFMQRDVRTSTKKANVYMNQPDPSNEMRTSSRRQRFESKYE